MLDVHGKLAETDWDVEARGERFVLLDCYQYVGYQRMSFFREKEGAEGLECGLDS